MTKPSSPALVALDAAITTKRRILDGEKQMTWGVVLLAACIVLTLAVVYQTNARDVTPTYIMAIGLTFALGLWAYTLGTARMLRSA